MWDDCLEELRGCIEDYLRQRGVSLRKAFRCLNPAHEDRHPSMSYNPRARKVHCFACGATYDLFDLIGLDYGLDSFPERLEKAAALFPGMVEEPDRPIHRAKTAPSLGRASLVETATKLAGKKPEPRPLLALASPPPPSSPLPGCTLPKGTEQLDYLLGRGITSETCAAFGLYQTADRAIFPIREGGVPTGWCGRALDEEMEPRYKNSPGPLGLWNGDLLAEDGQGRRLFVTEGVIDALCLLQLGEKAVALCGSQNTGKLLRRCERTLATANSWRFVLCGDPDEAGGKMNKTLSGGLDKLGIGWETLPLQRADGDIGGLYLRDRPRLEALLRGEGAEVAETGPQALEYAATAAAGELDDFFLQSRRRAERGAIPTGLAGLDKLLDGGLYPGLYVLGAISSLGKTSLALQMADAIAEGGRDVLFFTLEQSKHELMAKSLSRISAILDEGRGYAVSTRDLLSGVKGVSFTEKSVFSAVREAYLPAAQRLFLREGIAEIGPGDIRDGVRRHRELRGCAPVVVVDYLQILSPADHRATDKQNTDRAVIELKRLSRDFEIPVIAISSFNRENYRTAVSMEAFKESGAVEYSSDVLLGLQLKGAGEKDFDHNKAKLKQPRCLELVVLKNRTGIPYGKTELFYDAKYSLFLERKAVSMGHLVELRV